MDSAYRTAIRENIWKLYVLSSANWALLIVPVIVLFFQENGLTLQEVFTLQALFHLTSLVLEIPSGYLSDRWGRKNTCIAASFFSFIAIIVYSLSSSFWPFLVAEMLIAVGRSLYSGTVEALTYDTLLELKETDEYRRICGQQKFLRFLVEAIGGIIGGMLAVVSLRAPMAATLLPFGLCIIITFMLTEPRRHKLQETRHLEVMWRICKDTFVHNAALRSIIILPGIIATMTLCLFWLTQPYQLEIGLPLSLYGITHAVIVTAGAFAAKYSHTLQKWIDDRLLLLFVALSVIGSYIALGTVLSLWGLAFFLIARTAWGTLTPVISDIINRMTTSDIRATVISLQTFGFKLVFSITAPFLGYLTDVYTLNQAMLMIGAIGAVVLGVTFILMRNVWKDIPR